MAAFTRLLPEGFETACDRASESTALVIVEGEGYTRIGDETFHGRPHDVLVVPPWTPFSRHAEGEAVVFSFSDRAVQESLWREDKGDDA